jgi:hypothetical protein
MKVVEAENVKVENVEETEPEIENKKFQIHISPKVISIAKTAGKVALAVAAIGGLTLLVVKGFGVSAETKTTIDEAKETLTDLCGDNEQGE